MGTNFYVAPEKCHCCDHTPKPTHIGKKSAGWSFSFHATKELKSWAAWKTFLSNNEIVDELGDPVTLEEFSAMVENTKLDRNHTTHCKENHPEHAKESCFLDPEGYSFCTAYFS